MVKDYKYRKPNRIIKVIQEKIKMGIKKEKIIKVPYGMMTVLAKSYGLSIQGVYDALRFRSESERAALIRKDALENFGGQLMNVNKITR